jgi:hypothetical protein
MIWWLAKSIGRGLSRFLAFFIMYFLSAICWLLVDRDAFNGSENFVGIDLHPKDDFIWVLKGTKF